MRNYIIWGQILSMYVIVFVPASLWDWGPTTPWFYSPALVIPLMLGLSLPYFIFSTVLLRRKRSPDVEARS